MSFATRNQALTDFAEHLVKSGADRIPYRFDGRRIEALRRNGVLVYPDGTFSVTSDTMRDVVETWEMVARDRYVSEERRQELLSWCAAGRRFVEQHKALLASKKFGDLSASRYAALWVLVTGWTRADVHHEPEMTLKEKALWNTLEKLGYVTLERLGETVWVRPTPAADRLVEKTGNPYFA